MERVSSENPRQEVWWARLLREAMAGLLVSFVAVPFGIAFARASGYPEVSGLITTIVAGFCMLFLRGSHYTVTGPAAGLAPSLMAGVLLLGHGNKDVGYPMMGAAVGLTGLLQLLFVRLKLSRYLKIFPLPVMKGMLAGIGIIIIAQQIPNVLGVKFETTKVRGILSELPHHLSTMDMNREVFVLATACTIILSLLLWGRHKNWGKLSWAKKIPPQFIIVVGGTIAAWQVGLGEEFRIHMPSNIVDAFTFTNVRAFANPDTWWPLISIALLLCAVDTVEAGITVQALDQEDPQKRKSSLDGTIWAMGVLNAIFGFLIGTTTFLPGGFKSSYNREVGGRTLLAGMFCSIYIGIYLLFARDLINAIPMASLAAIMICTGWKLCNPSHWKKFRLVGTEQLAVFAVTAIVTGVQTDLLEGVVAGMATKLVLVMWFAYFRARKTPDGRRPTLFRIFWGIFTNPISRASENGGTGHIEVDGPLVCFNLHHALTRIGMFSANTRELVIHFNGGVGVVDHTAMVSLREQTSAWERDGRVIRLTGLDKMSKVSAHSDATHLAPASNWE
jgi:carbonic anhydrase